MQIGFIGLGRMGKIIVSRLLASGIGVVAWNRSQKPLEEVVETGAIGARDIDDLVSKLEPPRTIWVMVTAGEAVDELLNQLAGKLTPGDLVIDGGNSFYKDTLRRNETLSKKGIHFMDIGTSGGIEIAKTGACLMVGGNKEDYERISQVLKAVAAPEAYGLLGPVGAGHFAKMVHNGIEYGMMESIGEGAAILKNSEFNYDLREVFRVYSSKSIIDSRLVGWALNGLKESLELSDISSSIGSAGTGHRIPGEGDWTVQVAKERGIDIPAIEASVRVRDESAKIAEDSPEGFRNKVISAIRGQFGQHPVKKNKLKKNE